MRAFVMPVYNYINPAFEAFVMIYYVITSKHLKIYPRCFNLYISYFTSITIKLYFATSIYSVITTFYLPLIIQYVDKI